MPNLKKNWSSWNFMMSGDNAYTVYYMNRLQGVSDRMNFFVNINGQEHVNQEKVIQRITYHHPILLDMGHNGRSPTKARDTKASPPLHSTNLCNCIELFHPTGTLAFLSGLGQGLLLEQVEPSVCCSSSFWRPHACDRG